MHDYVLILFGAYSLGLGVLQAAEGLNKIIDDSSEVLDNLDGRNRNDPNANLYQDEDCY